MVCRTNCWQEGTARRSESMQQSSVMWLTPLPGNIRLSLHKEHIKLQHGNLAVPSSSSRPRVRLPPNCSTAPLGYRFSKHQHTILMHFLPWTPWTTLPKILFCVAACHAVNTLTQSSVKTKQNSLICMLCSNWMSF